MPSAHYHIMPHSKKGVIFQRAFQYILSKRKIWRSIMFVYSVRASGIRYFLLVFLTLTVLIGSIIVSRADTAAVFAEGNIDLSGVDEAEGRVAFIERFGYDIADTPVSEERFAVPSSFDRVLADYNEIQRRQGLDLTKYTGKKITRYTYEVKNYEGYEGTVYANLFVFRGRVVGCDISTADPSGFVEPLIKAEK